MIIPQNPVLKSKTAATWTAGAYGYAPEIIGWGNYTALAGTETMNLVVSDPAAPVIALTDVGPPANATQLVAAWNTLANTAMFTTALVYFTVGNNNSVVFHDPVMGAYLKTTITAPNFLKYGVPQQTINAATTPYALGVANFTVLGVGGDQMSVIVGDAAGTQVDLHLTAGAADATDVAADFNTQMQTALGTSDSYFAAVQGLVVLTDPAGLYVEVVSSDPSLGFSATVRTLADPTTSTFQVQANGDGPNPGTMSNPVLVPCYAVTGVAGDLQGSQSSASTTKLTLVINVDATDTVNDVQPAVYFAVAFDETDIPATATGITDFRLDTVIGSPTFSGGVATYAEGFKKLLLPQAGPASVATQKYAIPFDVMPGTRAIMFCVTGAGVSAALPPRIPATIELSIIPRAE